MSDEEEEEVMMHFCKVCGKMFSNDRSLGGHMRSHLSSLSSFQQEKEKEKASRRSNLKYCHQELSQSASEEEASEVVVVTKKRKRKRRVTSTDSESEKEDGALSLMMLSRDYSSIKQRSGSTQWINNVEELIKKSNLKKKKKRSMEHYFDSEYSNSNCSEKAKRSYDCVTCGKVFNSYQALGGHRTSHRKMEASTLGPNSHTDYRRRTVYRRRRRNNDHECPICHRVFSSGQALGGHKRSHLVSVTDYVSIHLNIPAAATDHI